MRNTQQPAPLTASSLLARLTQRWQTRFQGNTVGNPDEEPARDARLQVCAIGLGRYSNAALKYLSDRRDLGIHSDVVTDAIIRLLERGVLTGRCKTQQRRTTGAGRAAGPHRAHH